MEKRYKISSIYILFDSPSSPSLRAERDDCIEDAIRVSSQNKYLKTLK